MFTVYETTGATTGNFRIRFVNGVGVLQCEALVRVRHPDGSTSSGTAWREAMPSDHLHGGNRLIEFQGRMRSLQAWANALRISKRSLHRRLRKRTLAGALTDRRFL